MSISKHILKSPKSSIEAISESLFDRAAHLVNVASSRADFVYSTKLSESTVETGLTKELASEILGGYEAPITEEEESQDHIVDLLNDSIKNDYPVEFHLDDGNFVVVEPSDAKRFIESGEAADIANYMTDKDSFQSFITKSTPK